MLSRARLMLLLGLCGIAAQSIDLRGLVGEVMIAAVALEPGGESWHQRHGLEQVLGDHCAAAMFERFTDVTAVGFWKIDD